jgi:hypothetical protein
MSHYVPSVRGDALLLTHGRTGAADDLLLISAAVVLDGVLGGHIDVTGTRRVGLDRRRIAPGAAVPGAPKLMADLRERAIAVGGDTPWGWFERASLFALRRASDELIGAGVAEPFVPSDVYRLFRHDTLRVQWEAEAAARDRLADVLTGRLAPPHAIALACALHGCDLLNDVAGVRVDRRQLRAMTDAGRSLASGARAVLDTLQERRRGDAQVAA